MDFGYRNGCARHILMVSAAGLLLSSCNAATTLIDKQDLDIQTHMSETIFLDPVPDGEKKIFVAARNTSDHPEIDLKPQLLTKLQARGYTVVGDPKLAHFMVQMNVLQAGPVAPAKKNSFLASGYGSALDAALVGAAAGGLTSYATGNSNAGLGVGLGVAAAGFIADRLIKDVFFTVVTDIQIAVRPEKGGVVRESTRTSRGSDNSARQFHSVQGTGASEGVSTHSTSGSYNSNARTQSIETTSDFLKYNLRDVAYANQVNLKWENAAPMLIDKLSSSVANLFD